MPITDLPIARGGRTRYGARPERVRLPCDRRFRRNLFQACYEVTRVGLASEKERQSETTIKYRADVLAHFDDLFS